MEGDLTFNLPQKTTELLPNPTMITRGERKFPSERMTVTRVPSFLSPKFSLGPCNFLTSNSFALFYLN